MMRPPLGVAGAVVVALVLSVAHAGEVPADALKTWRAFREAVEGRDVEKVASLSAFPVRSNDLGGGDIASKSVLEGKFDEIFRDSFRECLAERGLEPGLKAGDYVVNCNGVMFGFRPRKGRYRFAYIENVNE